MCNGTWREQFSYYDGMAKIDWEDYEVPYNYTVSPKNTTSQVIPQPTCPRPSRYFAIFIAENVASLLAAAAYTITTLLWVRGSETRNRVVMAISRFIAPGLKAFKWVKGLIFKDSGSNSEHGTLFITIAMALIMSGLVSNRIWFLHWHNF
jgi:hypothetical protein